MFSKLVYKCNAIPIKLLAIFFSKPEKLIKKLTWKCKGPRIAKTILKKKNKLRDFALTRDEA